MYSDDDVARVAGHVKESISEDYRTPWRRDYARLIHSACFRRLQGKTQVFPGHESDFFRNRLTHSMEVAQIAKAIAVKLNALHPAFSGENAIEPDIVEFAGLAHDLGHPPFGHNGEEALDECMRNHGGFEGNAQTLRILSTLEKKVMITPNSGFKPFGSGGIDERCGLDLTMRSLAAIIKYDNIIPERAADRPSANELVKGYYKTDVDLVQKIKDAVVGPGFPGKFKTVECTIMDVADDIAYSTYDLEDVFKSGFFKPMDLFALDPSIYEAVVETINKRLAKQYSDQRYTAITERDVRDILHYVFFELFEVGTEQLEMIEDDNVTFEAKKMYLSAEAQRLSQQMAEDGYRRTSLSSGLVQLFLDSIEVIEHPEFPQLHNVRLDLDTFVIVEVLKNITFEAVIRAPALQVVEFRGKDIITKIFKAIQAEGGDRLLPKDYREIYRSGDEVFKKRTICDFIAGMTDRYAMEFYSRLFGANGMTMHKPL
ncbi:dGTP triphosphohydrolase [Agrobacterium tumefaciens]|uniref:dGTP triphosphohydrolase n=1 Tax=Agrobacterium tumefaciens TaxID=358 RepID=UPI00129B61EB|nr:dNTP triphosphohydrolase [Agrobacterium tumefaciens]MRH96238.1 dNTP triphosphohydrolase [Agrobacterium tumefaciens]